MTVPPRFPEAFARAQKLQASGRFQEAEQAYRELASPGEHRETVLQALVNLYLQVRQPGAAIDTLVALTEEVPDRLFYFSRLASLLDAVGHTDVAIGHYLRLLQRKPEMADAHFNLALLYKKNKQYGRAIEAYEQAIRFGIERPAEARSNMGVLYAEMRRADRADQMYRRALEADPDYTSAKFNRAGLLEETGDREGAIAIYRGILADNPRHWPSLARLAYASDVAADGDPIIETLQQAIADSEGDADVEPAAREGLYFALGKVLDDTARYPDAFAAYETANELGRARGRPYDRSSTERAFGQLIEIFDSDWVGRNASSSLATPIFICGMFRSGSTLLEQIVGTHPSVTTGGELDLLPWLIGRKVSPYPQAARGLSASQLSEMAAEYLAKASELFPEAKLVTDKRPDNFVHLGLVKAMFPAARILYTRREAIDNCLSIWFQQLGSNLSYATDLANIAHYYRQHERLMEHWQLSFASNIHTVSYDELVVSPEPVLRRLLTFLGVDWDDRCLDRPRTGNLVQTASVWQVRGEMHSRSSGRWRNYEPFLDTLKAELAPPG